MKHRGSRKGRPIIIGIGGSHSKIGKTTVGEAIMNRLRGWGAIKYTKTAIYSSIIEDKDILSAKGKDTGRYLDSGATAILWVQSPKSRLSEVMPIALDKLSHLEGIILEGNSAIEVLNPDIIIFIAEKNSSRIKESGKRILDLADIIYYRDTGEIKIKHRESIKGGVEELASTVYDMVDKRKEIESILIMKAKEGRIPCSLARKIAEDIKVSYKEVGSIANELGIKISNCELGCF